MLFHNASMRKNESCSLFDATRDFFLPSSAAVRRSETALLRKKKIQNQTKKRWSSEKDELPEKIAHLKERVVAKKTHLISTNYEKKVGKRFIVPYRGMASARGRWNG